MQYPQTLIVLSLLIASSQTQAAPPVHHYEYDTNDNPTKVTNGLNNATKQHYDRLDRPILTEQPHATASGQQGTIQTQYNVMDEVVNVTDPRALATTYSKNAFGEIISQTSPDTGTTSFTYDNAGNMLTRTDARGAVATYTYDKASRLTSATYKPSSGASADETVQFAYDTGTPYGNGRLGRINDSVGTLFFETDPQGRAWYKRQNIGGFFFDYLYARDNNSGRLWAYGYATNPGANLITYEHNANAQIDKMSVNGQLILQNVLYYPDGSVASWEWGNGQVYDRFNDTSGRVERYTVGDKLQNLVYDNAGRIQQTYRSLVATPNTPINNTIVNYNYDNLDRITGNTTNSTNHGYNYDLTGNRTGLVIGGNSYPYTIATNSNRLMAEAGPTAHSNTYDNAGNLKSNGQDTYTYYASGRLKQVTRNGTVIASYKYNGLGELVQKTNSSNVSTYYLYDNDHHLVGEYNQQGQAIQTYIYLGDIPVAVIKNGSGTIQDNLFYIYTDHLNTPREIRNHANQQRWTWYPETAEAFGANPPDDNPQGLGAFNFNVRFPGQLYDPVTQLSYNYYRDYNPRTGRYTTSDPIGLQGGINTYAYVEGNPMSYTDPTGEFVPQLIGFGIGAGLEYLTNPCASAADLIFAGGLGAVGGGLSKAALLRFGPRSLTRETGLEWSHSVSRNSVNRHTSGSLNRALNQRGGLNGSWRTPSSHARHDPSRHVPGVEPMPYPLRVLDRTPDWLKGTALGGGVGAAVAGGGCECR